MKGPSLAAATVALLFLIGGCAKRIAPGTQTPPLVIFFVNGIQLSDAATDSIWHGTAETRPTDSVRVLKSPRDLDRYGAMGRPGVVLIYLRAGTGERVPKTVQLEEAAR